jgi:hypothetical protein
MIKAVTQEGAVHLRPLVVRRVCGGDGLHAALVACNSEAPKQVRFPIVYGDLLVAEGAAVLASSFPELLFDLYYQPKPWLVRVLWRTRGFVGRVLGWERHPKNGVFPNQWRDVSQPLHVGQRVGFMRLTHLFDDEALLHIENATVEAVFVVRRMGHQLYMGSIVRPKGLAGQIYWRCIQPFHELVIRGWLSGVGRTRSAHHMGGA